MKKVLVTGGCGFIGSNLIPLLLDSGYEVRVLDNLSVGNLENLAGMDVEIIEGDVREMTTVSKSIHGCHLVVHLAAQTGVIPSQHNPRLDFETNVGGTLNLLQESVSQNIEKFILASSNAPLGKVVPPIDEQKPPHPLSPYGASKLAGEGYCHAFYGSYGLPTVVLRFANVYGIGSNHKESVVARFIKDILDHDEMIIYGDGHQTRDLIFVSDLSKAILKALETQTSNGHVIQIATGVETQINGLAEKIRLAMNRPDATIRHLPARAGEIIRNYSCIDLAKALLNWQPITSLDKGISLTCQWFLNNRKLKR